MTIWLKYDQEDLVRFIYLRFVKSAFDSIMKIKINWRLHIANQQTVTVASKVLKKNIFYIVLSLFIHANGKVALDSLVDKMPIAPSTLLWANLEWNIHWYV